MDVWLIGESNPYGSDPKYALYPRPLFAAGARLCRVLGLTEREYLSRFRRANLLVGDRWSAPAARESASKLLAESVGTEDRLVLLGARVSAAFGVAFAPLSLGSSGGRKVLVIPHPSGRSRVWNDPTMMERVRAAVETFVA